jgi:hypothetical protein
MSDLLPWADGPPHLFYWIPDSFVYAKLHIEESAFDAEADRGAFLEDGQRRVNAGESRGACARDMIFSRVRLRAGRGETWNN